ncbi:Alpha/Beta hydrolase protein [Aspergillus pseudoustus]|uniref:Alpha/Beta hydrolase protein n=1 Tax=Aspergillus pseudoustus TaxID=1810923 RepID=A0ABR4IHM0_9EURO
MDQLTRKSLITTRKYTYTYYHIAQSPHKPTLLLQHGFPDDHTLWTRILPFLLASNHSILIPDLLGYAGTSKPTDTAAYNSKGMAADLAEILDHEKIAQIVSIGHDWGSYMAQRVWLWCPERVAGLVMLNVAYDPPAPFDLAATNKAIESETGLPRLAYWEFFSAPDCAGVLSKNIDSWFEALHGDPDNWLETLFCHRNALSGFVRRGKRVPLHGYAEALRANWVATFKDFGFAGPLQWYLAKVNGYQWDVEKQLPRERHVVTMPTLFVGAMRDTVCTTAAIEVPKGQGLLPELTVEEVDSGHWPMLEAPGPTGEVIVKWLKEKF